MVGLLLLRALDLLPFVKAIGQDQAPVLTECSPKRRLGGRRLGAGVNQGVADFWIVGPVRDQPPAQVDKFGPRGLGKMTDRQHRLSRGDVITRFQGWSIKEREQLFQGIGRSAEGEAATHLRHLAQVGIPGPFDATAWPSEFPEDFPGQPCRDVIASTFWSDSRTS